MRIGRCREAGLDVTRSLLAAPDAATLQGKRDRAMLSSLLYHGLRAPDFFGFLCSSRIERQTKAESV